MSVTLLQLRTRARQRADMVNDTFVTDSELTSMVNSSIAELHDILVTEYSENYKVKTVLYTLGTTSAAEYGGDSGNDIVVVDLDTIFTDLDFYKLIGIDAKFGTNWITLNSFAMNERNRGAFSSLFGFFSYLRYRIDGHKIVFQPIPSSTTQLRCWYVPIASQLSLDIDTLDDLNNYSEFIVLDCAIKMKIKREEDVTDLERQRTRAQKRIEVAAQNRDAGRAEGITDISNLENPWWWIV